MFLLFKPLAINIFFIGTLLVLFYIILVLLININKKSAKIEQFYIKNQLFSGLCILFYILIFVIGTYILRLFNLPRKIDLKEIYKQIISLGKDHELFSLTKGYFLIISILLLIILLLGLWKTKKLLFAEIHKWFILASIINHMSETKSYWVFLELKKISTQDLLAYALFQSACKLSEKDRKKKEQLQKKQITIHEYDHMQHWYHYSKLVNVFYKKEYPIVRKCSPFFFVVYDCVFNDFVLTHVFYYLLLFVPLMLIRHITTVFGNNAHYVTRLIWNIYYSPEPYVYLIPPNLKLLFDDYLMSGLTTNLTFNDITGPEEFLLNISHFKIEDKEFGIYLNVGQCLGVGMDQLITLRTKDDKHFHRLIEDDEGNIIEAEEWVLLADNRAKELFNAR